MYISTYIYIHIYRYIFIYVFAYVYIYIYVYIQVHIYIGIYSYICMCMCVLIYLLYICINTYIYKCKVHVYRDKTASEQCYCTETGNCVNLGSVSFPLMSFHQHAFCIYSGKTIPKYTYCDMYIRMCIRNICMFTFICTPI